MAVVGKKAYPKATLKKIVKAHANLNLKRNADVTVGRSLFLLAHVLTECQIYLNYVLFMETLVKEAAIDSKLYGDKKLASRSVKKVTRDTLAKFKG
ncbi:Histone-fold domain-containing protein-like protein [Emericellopsis cladophorae]|uniref:Histone-fold domain-containing protein-like protein n=1 Tax=Emericellopsis cladophorae TaxID=2686198 RepID=A0A9P9XYL0_9HYPO|nr:Histone-fold domain-containing protein-like protein [Emericellopsis cladophorae]KAI6780279.1 Histone-fold domain-containing protein-like protein [Emericellopsis cladophorae]